MRNLIWVTLQRCKTAREAILMFDQPLATQLPGKTAKAGERLWLRL